MTDKDRPEQTDKLDDIRRLRAFVDALPADTRGKAQTAADLDARAAELLDAARRETWDTGTETTTVTLDNSTGTYTPTGPFDPPYGSLDRRSYELGFEDGRRTATQEGQEPPDPPPPERPHVHVDPAMRFGQPHVGGVSTEMLAGQMSAGADAEEVCEDYGLTRHQLLVALWFEGTHGSKRHRKLYGGWAEKVAYPVLSGFDKTISVDEIPFPEVEHG